MSVEASNILQLIIGAVTAIGVIVAGFWALARLVVAQFEKRLDERFELQEKARVEGRRTSEERWGRIESAQMRQEREFLTLKADLPIHYVRREDWVRNQSIIEARLDGLALMIQNAQLKGARNA